MMNNQYKTQATPPEKLQAAAIAGSLAGTWNVELEKEND